MTDTESVSGDAAKKKMPKQQLSKGMEHMRAYVTVDVDSTSAPTTPPTETTATKEEEEEEEAPSSQPEGESTYGVPASIQPLRKPQTSSSENEQKRTDPFQFGSRYLEEGDDIFAFNAWDHVETDETYKAFIKEQEEFQRSAPVSDFDKKRFNTAPEKWWDKFYSNNKANFFKDRKWLVQEFPVLGEVTKEDYGEATVLEVGAGAGNTAFPVKALNKNPGLKIHACDYSKKAVEIIRSQETYDGDVLKADVWDAASTSELPPGLDAGSVDVVVMIFIFSALEPRQWAQCVRNIFTLLKPGGLVLFRDYGRGDLAQVRFKKGRYLEENFYIRGDGTRVYFFEKQELQEIWGGELPGNAFAKKDVEGQLKDLSVEDGDGEKEKDGEDVEVGDEKEKLPRFEILDLGVDNRMLVNRQRKLKMYRCWMQGRFRKPLQS